MNKAKNLRELFKSKPILKLMGAHNGLGAKLIERNGFDGVWASGLEISTAHAVPDANILTMTDFLAAARSMNESTSLPIIADCDTGFGNSLNVIHMVQKYEAADIAAVVIEDKLFPKVNSFVPGRQDLAPIEEFMGKIQAAKNTQKNSDFMVFARVEALIAGWGMEEALRRAYSYAEAGADGIVIHSKASTPDEIYTFAQRWKGSTPLVVIPTMFFNVTADEFRRQGFKMVIYANQGLRASVQAMNETFKSIIQTGSSAAVEDKITPMKEIFEIQGMLELKKNEALYSKKNNIQAVIPAAGDHHLQTGFNDILKDAPLCMLKIGGKTLIDRQIEMLNSCHINDIYVISGHLSDKVKADGAKIIRNLNYADTGNASSILAARDHFKSKCVFAFSDIIVNRTILDKLLSSPHAITLVIDRAYQTLPARDKKLDLVIAASDSQVQKDARKLELDHFRLISRVGQKIDRKQANYEFIGMALFNEEGLNELGLAWDEANKKFKTSPFYEAPNVQKADFNDLLQFIIDRGFPIHGLEVEHGWSEIHSIQDFERVKSHFEKKPQNIS